MPTDLPPDYKPQPLPSPGGPEGTRDPGAAPAPPQGSDSPGVRRPGTGLPGRVGDAVDPTPGFGDSPVAPAAGPEMPVPAGLPSF